MLLKFEWSDLLMEYNDQKKKTRVKSKSKYFVF